MKDAHVIKRVKISEQQNHQLDEMKKHFNCLNHSEVIRMSLTKLYEEIKKQHTDTVSGD